MNEEEEVLDAYTPRQSSSEEDPLTYFMIIFRPLCLGAGLFLLGTLFKLQSWPYATQLLMLSTVVFIAGCFMSLTWHSRQYKIYDFWLLLQVLGSAIVAFGFWMLGSGMAGQKYFVLTGGLLLVIGHFLYTPQYKA